MLSVSDSIMLGVISGILTSFVIWLVLQIFQKTILPWYQTITYQGLKISGAWIGIFSDKTSPSTIDDPDYVIYINQKGHFIEGSLIRNKNHDGSRGSKEFTFNGLFRDGNLVLTYKPKDNTRLGLGAYVMMLTSDGRKLEGTSVYVGANNRIVGQFKISWIRKLD
mgnify:CR=1 FL=1